MANLFPFGLNSLTSELRIKQLCDSYDAAFLASFEAATTFDDFSDELQEHLQEAKILMQDLISFLLLETLKMLLVLETILG